MQVVKRHATYSMVTVATAAVAAGLAALGAGFGAPAGAIVLGEISGLACVVAFTLLIWAAIQDGKPPARAGAE